MATLYHAEPPPQRQSPSPTKTATSSLSNSIVLPPGWVMYIALNGTPYYAHPTTHTTQWDFPTNSHDPGEKKQPTNARVIQEYDQEEEEEEEEEEEQQQQQQQQQENNMDTNNIATVSITSSQVYDEMLYEYRKYEQDYHNYNNHHYEHDSNLNNNYNNSHHHDRTNNRANNAHHKDIPSRASSGQRADDGDAFQMHSNHHRLKNVHDSINSVVGSENYMSTHAPTQLTSSSQYDTSATQIGNENVNNHNDDEGNFHPNGNGQESIVKESAAVTTTKTETAATAIETTVAQQVRQPKRKPPLTIKIPSGMETLKLASPTQSDESATKLTPLPTPTEGSTQTPLATPTAGANPPPSNTSSPPLTLMGSERHGSGPAAIIDNIDKNSAYINKKTSHDEHESEDEKIENNHDDDDDDDNVIIDNHHMELPPIVSIADFLLPEIPSAVLQSPSFLDTTQIRNFRLDDCCCNGNNIGITVARDVTSLTPLMRMVRATDQTTAMTMSMNGTHVIELSDMGSFTVVDCHGCERYTYSRHNGIIRKYMPPSDAIDIDRFSNANEEKTGDDNYNALSHEPQPPSVTLSVEKQRYGILIRGNNKFRPIVVSEMKKRRRTKTSMSSSTSSSSSCSSSSEKKSIDVRKLHPGYEIKYMQNTKDRNRKYVANVSADQIGSNSSSSALPDCAHFQDVGNDEGQDSGVFRIITVGEGVDAALVMTLVLVADVLFKRDKSGQSCNGHNRGSELYKGVGVKTQSNCTGFTKINKFEPVANNAN